MPIQSGTYIVQISSYGYTETTIVSICTYTYNTISQKVILTVLVTSPQLSQVSSHELGSMHVGMYWLLHCTLTDYVTFLKFLKQSRAWNSCNNLFKQRLAIVFLSKKLPFLSRELGTICFCELCRTWILSNN